MDWALRCKWLRYHALFKPLGRLPPPLAYRGAARIGHYDRNHQRDAYNAIAAGLCKAFPTQTADRGVLDGWLKHYFAMMARETLDVFCMAQVDRDHDPGIVRLAPGTLEALREAKRGGRGVIIAMAHYSRINMLLYGLALAGETLGMLTIAIDERNRDLDPVTRAYLHHKVGTLYRCIGGAWLTLADDLRGLYKVLSAGETMVILFDAFNPERAQSTLQAPFLGGMLTVTRGIERLAAKTGAAIVYGVAHERGWRIEAELRPLPAEPEAALRAAVVELERDVRAAPWSWWQWNILDAIWTAPGR